MTTYFVTYQVQVDAPDEIKAVEAGREALAHYNDDRVNLKLTVVEYAPSPSEIKTETYKPKPSRYKVK